MIRRTGFWPWLMVVAILSLAVRLVGLDWDRGLYLHPDERFIAWVTTDLRWPESLGQYFNAATSPLNPYNTQHNSFVYGTFPSFLVKAIAGVFGLDTYSQIYAIGRATNAVFDTGTVLLTALVARRFFDERAGLLAGLLLAFTPLFIQSAHFFTVDTISVFFAVAAFACVLRSWDRASIGWMALAGVMIGLAGASKPNYLISIAFVALPALELVRLKGWRSLLPRLNEPMYPAVPATLTGGFVAFWTFRVAQPYAFSGPQWWNISLNQQWLDDLSFWRAVQTGLVDMKPSIQWIDRTPVVYILQNMVLWGMGIALGVLSIVTLALAIWRIARSARWPSWWWLGIIGWCVGSIAMYGTGIAQNQRYLMHIYPFLIILVAGFLIELEQRLTRKWIAQVLTAGVLVYTVVFGLAFASLYVRPNTRIEASEWIYQNIPTGSVLSNEYWDDALPMPVQGEDRSRFTGMTLDLYADEAENNDKVPTLVAQVSQVDYIVISSNRVIDSVIRQPERYPVAVRFYEMLLSGELGFEPIAHFYQGPEILGIEWDDRTAEESLTVYEHPEVRIFVKTGDFDAQHIHDELNTAWGYGGYHYIPGDPLPRQMLMGDTEIEALNEHGGWANQVQDGFFQNHPVIGWWLAMNVLGLAAWPITWRSFRNLPDMGWMLSKALGLIGVAVIALALVSWGNLPFARSTIILAIVLMATGGLAARRCIWDEFRYKLRRRWMSLLAGELLFIGIFLAMALIRSWQRILPDHNMQQLTGVMRSVSLPPMDPWLSGGVLHTFWAGLLPWASLGRLLSLEPVVVANLAVIGTMAVIAGVSWSLIHAYGHSWIGVMTALVIAFGSSFAFYAGLTPIAMSASVDLVVLAALMVVVVLVHTLMIHPREHLTRHAVVAIVVGALSVAIGWGLLLGVALVAIGIAIRAWIQRPDALMWWPVVRRFVLELIGIIAVGIAIWYPAYSVHTVTSRNLINPGLWSLSVLRDQLGLILLMAVMMVVGVGAVSVIAALLKECTPGIIVSGISIGSAIVLMALAGRFDSALLLLLLISFLAVTTAWHWLEDKALLWAVTLILLSCMVLAVAQTRPMHPDSTGVSTAMQLLPLAWTLIVLALGIAVARAVHGFTVRVSFPAIAAVSMVVLLLLAPSFDHLRTSDRERTALSNPAILAPQTELQAAQWLQDHAVGAPVILTADGPDSGSAGTISALTGFPTVLGSNHVERYTRPGWERMVEQRSMDIATIYTGVRDWSLVSPLIAQYDIRYIVIGPEERTRFGGIDGAFATAEANGHLQLVFEYNDIRIYSVGIVPPTIED